MVNLAPGNPLDELFGFIPLSNARGLLQQPIDNYHTKKNGAYLLLLFMENVDVPKIFCRVSHFGLLVS